MFDELMAVSSYTIDSQLYNHRFLSPWHVCRCQELVVTEWKHFEEFKLSQNTCVSALTDTPEKIKR
jgi:hypothetical protein